MPLNDIITETIAKLTARIEELKTQINNLKNKTSELDAKYTTTYNQSVSLADAIAQQAEKLRAMTEQVNELENNTSRTTTTPPTADGTGLPGFVILDTKPETEYQNYVYIYPKE